MKFTSLLMFCFMAAPLWSQQIQLNINGSGSGQQFTTTGPFNVATVSSSPDAAVMVTFADGWAAFELEGDTSCTNVAQSIPLQTTSTPIQLQACLINPDWGGTFFEFLTASAGGFPSVSNAWQVTSFPGGDISVSPNAAPFIAGMVTATVSLSNGTFNGYQICYGETYDGSQTCPPPVSPWLQEKDNCGGQNPVTAPNSCVAKISLASTPGGVIAGQQYAAQIYFYTDTGSKASIKVTYTYNGPQTSRLPGDMNVVGDFDGDGQLDAAVWRPLNGTWYVIPSGSPSIPMIQQWGLPGDIPIPADYDHDGKTDFAVWRPRNGTWYIVPSSSSAVPRIRQWGSTGDIPVSGDFDGDGKADLAVWRPSNGTWYIALSSNPTPLVSQWGLPGDVPVSGDFDGSGKQEVAVWRPSNGLWYVVSRRTGASFTQQWGLPGDVPVSCDFDSDGNTDYAVWRPSEENLYILPSSNPSAPYSRQLTTPTDLMSTSFEVGNIGKGVFVRVTGDFDGDGQLDFALWNPATGIWFIVPSRSPGTPIQQRWGQAGDVPVAGDYDGDGRTDLAVWRPSNGTWYIIPSATPQTPITQQFGLAGDVPVVGDFDGQGKAIYAVWRPSNGTWYVLSDFAGSYSQQWGLPGDVPVAGDFGDGRTDYAVWRRSNAVWYIMPSRGGQAYSQQWGLPGDVPLAADFGSGETAYGVWRPSTQSWFVMPRAQPPTALELKSGLTGNGQVYIRRE